MTRRDDTEGPQHLSPDQMAEIRKGLESELRRLARSMEITQDAARPVELDQQAVGRLSRMDSLQNQHLTKNLREREQVRAAALSRALRRMDDGTYATCIACSGPIAVGRLFVFPEAERCSKCPE